MLPYKTKICEPIPFPSREERRREIEKAGYNLYGLPSEKVTIDLLSDSGTSAMSQEQWARMLIADESLSYSRSYFHFVEKIKESFGYEYILPIHQGRSGEHLLFKVFVKEGDHVPSNGHYATTRENISYHGGIAISLFCEKAFNASSLDPFKGEMDLKGLKTLLDQKSVPLVILTITNNDGAGQPVSLKHIQEIREILLPRGIPLFFDACRFAENAHLIQKREKGYEKKSIKEIVRETFSLGEGCFVSLKKDGLSNIGGFLGMRDENLYEKIRNYLLLMEGFFTEGGLAGRDLEAMTLGIEESMEESYLTARAEQVQRLGEALVKSGIPVYLPLGGHAVYLLVEAFVPHLKEDSYRSYALASEFYIEGGVRTLPDSSPGLFEMIRLAIPRRVYSDDHLDYVAEVISRVYERRDSIQGLRKTYEPPFLKHFISRFER